MSETQEAPKLSLLEQFKQQKDAFVAQGTQLQAQFQQVQGAVFACEQMILKIEAQAKEHILELAKKTQEGLSQENLGDNSNGEADKQAEEQTPQE